MRHGITRHFTCIRWLDRRGKNRYRAPRFLLRRPPVESSSSLGGFVPVLPQGGGFVLRSRYFPRPARPLSEARRRPPISSLSSVPKSADRRQEKQQPERVCRTAISSLELAAPNPRDLTPLRVARQMGARRHLPELFGFDVAVVESIAAEQSPADVSVRLCPDDGVAAGKGTDKMLAPVFATDPAREPPALLTIDHHLDRNLRKIYCCSVFTQ
jgi:hypothetical protein